MNFPHLDEAEKTAFTEAVAKWLQIMNFTTAATESMNANVLCLTFPIWSLIAKKSAPAAAKNPNCQVLSTKN